MYHQWPENPKTFVPIKRDQPHERERDEQKSVGEDRRDEKGAAHVREKEVARTIFREDLPLPDVCVRMSVNSNS